jgi:hypothetical protein
MKMIKGILVFCWTLLAGYLYFREWNDPTALEHPLSLFNRELVLLFSDIPAAFLKLFTGGIAGVLFIVVLGLASLGAGRFLLNRFQAKGIDSQLLCLPVALGLVLLGYFVFFLGLIGGFNRSGFILVWVVLSVSALTGCHEVLKILKRAPLRFSWPTICCFCLLGIIWAFLFAKALWPAVHYDAITYHLGVPKYYLLEGAISYIPYDSCSNFPFLAEMLYTLCFFAAGQKAAQLSSVFMYILTACALYEFAKTFIREMPPWLPMLFYSVIPSGMTFTVYYGSDIHLAFYVIITLYVFFLWEQHRRPFFLVLLGLFAGACLSMKYAALAYIPLLLVIGTGFVAGKSKKFFVKQWLCSLAICGTAALVVFGPWLVKNYLYVGNPFYPGFFNLFGGTDMNLEMYRNIQKMVSTSDFNLMVKGLWENPGRLLLFRPNTLDNSLDRNLGPVLLFFFPMIVFNKNLSAVIKKILFAGVMIYIVWCFTFFSTRFFFPAVGLLILAAAYAVTETARQVSAPFSLWIKTTAFFLVFFSCITGFCQVNLVTQTYGFDFIKESDDKFLQRHMIDNRSAILFSYPVYAYVNAHLPTDTVILVIGDAQHLYLDRRHRYTYLSAVSSYDIFKTAPNNHPEIACSLKSDGITHIIYNPIEMSRLEQVGASLFTERDQDAIESFLSSRYVTRMYCRRFHVYPTGRKNFADSVCLYELL